jgi:hypothetical protein
VSRRARWLWIAAAALIVAAGVFRLAERALWWYRFEQFVAWDSWLVPLPQGGSIHYEDRSPRMHLFGPSDSEKTLTWIRADGSSQSYPISGVGGGYLGLELHLRKDGQAIWLVSLDQNRIVAPLDLGTGRFTSEDGTVYDARGNQSTGASRTPAWASRTGGRVLARR